MSGGGGGGGAQGPQGAQGAQGDAGAQGVQGSSGPSGNAGYSALVSVSSATVLTSSAIGKLHVCSASSAYAVTLPSASSCNGYAIGIQIDSTSTAIVTLTAAGSDTIDGAATRMMWAGEMAQVYSDGSKWIKIAGKSIPMIGGLTNNSTTTLASGTDTKVNLGAVASVSNSPPGMNDTANSKLIVQRTAKYLIFAAHRITGFTLDRPAEIRIFKDNVEWRINSRYVTANDSPVIQLNTAAVLTAGDSFYITAKQYTGVNRTINIDENNIFTMVEVPEW